MKDVLIENGDLVPGRRGVEEVRGIDRMRQQLTHALLEPFGVDRFHPRWGSILSSMIGQQSTPELRAQVEVEVSRVIKNYLYVQRYVSERLARTYGRTFLSADEVVGGIKFVGITPVNDRVYVILDLVSGTGKNVSIRLSNEVR